MASCTASSLVVSPSCSFVEKSIAAPRSVALRPVMVANRSRIVMSAEKEQNLAFPTTVALLAACILPEIAEAASPGVSPSLKNLLLSVLAGGTVLGGIGIAVAGVSTFDPVKRK